MQHFLGVDYKKKIACSTFVYSTLVLTDSHRFRTLPVNTVDFYWLALKTKWTHDQWQGPEKVTDRGSDCVCADS